MSEPKSGAAKDLVVQAGRPESPTPGTLLQMAIQQNLDLDKLEKIMDLQAKYEAAQAKKAYDAAFAAFKVEATKIIRDTKVNDGPLKGKAYAKLSTVVNAITPALSKHGLSSSWKLTKDEKDWIEVTCTIRHVDGHIESVSMGGPPDTGGAKSMLQSRASTVTYLERYTLKAITGLSEQDDDDDAQGPAATDLEPIREALTLITRLEELTAYFEQPEIKKLHTNQEVLNLFTKRKLEIVRPTAAKASARKPAEPAKPAAQ